MPKAFEEFNLNEYDVVITSSSCCAKGVITGPHTLNICYCYTPMRYAWEMRDEYTEGMSNLKTKQEQTKVFRRLYLRNLLF